MKFLLLVHHNETAFAAMRDTVKRVLLAESVRVTHELHAQGQYVHASPLMPSAEGARTRRPVLGRTQLFDTRSIRARVDAGA